MFKETRCFIALKMPFLRRFILSKKEGINLSLEQTRLTFEIFGYDMSNFSDQELLDSVKKSSVLFKECGVSAKEFANALTKLQ